MSIFDLVFIVIFFATVVTLFIAAFSAIRGRGAGAIRILRGYAICAGIYLASGIGVIYTGRAGITV